jgi:hypothetical protein
VYGRKYNVPHLIPPAYEELCSRNDWLTDEEGERLGLTEVLKIARVWTALRSPAHIQSSLEQRSIIIRNVLGELDSAEMSDSASFPGMKRDTDASFISRTLEALDPASQALARAYQVFHSARASLQKHELEASRAFVKADIKQAAASKATASKAKRASKAQERVAETQQNVLVSHAELQAAEAMLAAAQIDLDAIVRSVALLVPKA